MLIELSFWFAALLLSYIHVGYPLLLWLWAKLRKRPTAIRPIHPSVSILVVAYNEAERIRQRLENLLALDYPRERVEIIVASDGSTDATVSRANDYRRAGVTVLAFDRRRGKSAVLNELIPLAHGDILLLADARQRFDVDALRALAQHFADPSVGAVSGELLLSSGLDGSAAGDGVGFYWRYEKFIRRNEGRLDSVIGATGAIYAIRRKLFEPIPPDTILDDVLIPMRIARRGYRIVFEPDALAYDRTSTAEVELTRKIRTLAGNFQLFARERWLLKPWSNRLWLQTVSHKFFRLLGPFCLGAAMVTNLFLLEQPLYRWTLLLQLLFYAAAALRWSLHERHCTLRLLNLPYTFCLLNWAVLLGLMRFISGSQSAAWERTAQQPVPGSPSHSH